MENYKSVLVKDTTKHCNVVVNIYLSYDPLCWLSSSSKIIQPGKAYLHRSEKKYKFKIKTICDSQSKTVQYVRKWTEDLHINIFNDTEAKESNLENHVMEKTLCIRRSNVEKEASIGDGRDLYEILKLNYEEIKKVEKDKQDIEIKRAFRREIRRYHSDTAGENRDDEMAHEVIVAHDILQNREKRADYHNKVDYNKGWFSRCKSIFFSECETEEQKSKRTKRLIMMALSFGIGVSGLTLAIATAGFAIPKVVGVCGTLGTGFFGAGVQGFLRTIKEKSVENGCTKGDFAKSCGIGFVAGAVTGGAAVWITAAVSVVGSFATHASLTKIGQYIAASSASSSIEGTSFTIASDSDKKLVDGIDLSWKRVIAHAVVGGLIGAVSGTTVGAVTGAIAGISPEICGSNVDERLVPSVRRLGVLMLKNVSRTFGRKATQAVLGSVVGIIEERLDKNTENRPVGNHLKKASITFVTDVASTVAKTTASHVSNECHVWKKVHNHGNYFSDKHLRQTARCNMDRESTLQWNEMNFQDKYNSILDMENEETNFRPNQTMTDESEGIIEPTARFKFLSHGLWISKMVLEYELEDKNNNTIIETKEVTENEMGILIPLKSRNIKVSFKVLRFILTWCDVKKWDRHTQTWYPEPHVFKYETPPEQRTFTLDGGLYYEKVVHVTNETHDDSDEV